MTGRKSNESDEQTVDQADPVRSACGPAAVGTLYRLRGRKGYVKEENTGRDAVSYPYLIRTPSAIWHISKADIELLGEDAYYEGLYAMLDLAEDDLADARAALEGFIPVEIEPVNIYTDFCNKNEFSFLAPAYYDGTRNEIRLFEGWNKASHMPAQRARRPRRTSISTSSAPCG